MTGVALEVFGSADARGAILRAREIGYQAVGIPASRRDFSVRRIGESGTRDLAAYLAKNGLQASLVTTGDRGRFTVSSMLGEDVEMVRGVIDFAGRLRAGAVAVRVGQLGNQDSQAAGSFRQAVAFLAAAADRAGIQAAFAGAPGEESLLEAVLSAFPDAPAGRLVSPGEALFSGRDAADDVLEATRISAAIASDCSAEEMNLAPGEGRVGWAEVLAALAARDYHGYLTVSFAPRGDNAARAAKALGVLRGKSLW
jgi:sugar phosphate isomerase/epimerase